MGATFYGGVFGSSRGGGGVGGDGLTTEQVATLIASARDFKGAYDAETTYAQFHSVAHDYGYALSRTNGNLGNDPLTDDGSNWILFTNGNRVSEWWGRNQSEELPTSTIPASQSVTSEGIIGFIGTPVPTLNQNGGVPGIILSDISAITNADPTVSLANTGITIPPGYYEITAEFYGNQLPDDDVHIRWMKVQSGTDQIERLIGTQRQRNFVGTGANDVHAHYEMTRKLPITANTTFYFQLVNFGSGQNRIAGFFQVERKA